MSAQSRTNDTGVYLLLVIYYADMYYIYTFFYDDIYLFIYLFSISILTFEGLGEGKSKFKG